MSEPKLTGRQLRHELLLAYWLIEGMQPDTAIGRAKDRVTNAIISGNRRKMFAVLRKPHWHM